MKTFKSVKWALLMLLLAIASVGNAWADRGRGHFGVYIGAPLSPWYYPYPHPYPYYYPPYPPVVIERAPPVYIEQQAAPVAQEQQTNYWYYCQASKAYYPYVKECSGGWQKVLPQPPVQP